MTMQREAYEAWLACAALDEETRNELLAVEQDEEEIKSRFDGFLSFGTAGLRGILGAGTNRMNRYTVRQATAALAKYMLDCGAEACAKGVAVAYDSRIMSREFAMDVCAVLAGYGIRSYLFDALRPTPELSFAIRELGCLAGVNITASHNPKQYNGYKVYWSDGAQIGIEQAEKIAALIRETDLFTGVKMLSEEETKAFVTVLDRTFDEKYMACVLDQIQNKKAIEENAAMKVIYTPFHGAGCRIVPEILKRAGFTNVYTVEKQMTPDGLFPTVKSPNPENIEGFAIAMEMATALEADLIVGTDPDCDRMGVVVREKDGSFTALSGNQTGMILLDYILSAKKNLGQLPENACAVKTIVSTEMTARICEAYGVSLYNVLTGFKFIGEKMEMFKKTGKGTFMLGFEESYGYLVGDYARDKDGAVASLLVCEAAAYYASRQMTLADAMEELYRKYGYHTEKTLNLNMEKGGTVAMKALMKKLRDEPCTDIGGIAVTECKDYLDGIDGLPASDVLYYVLADRSVVVVRPSGTEPKVKIYVMTAGKTKEESLRKNELLATSFQLICFE